MLELISNLHMHTVYSDGSGSLTDLARAALRSDLDVIIITDHNVMVKDFEGYHQEGNRKVLVMVGEELHDRARDPQKNHLIVIGSDRELSSFTQDPQQVINQALKHGGVVFIAHPFEDALPTFGETDITWVDWQVENFTGIELWNGLSELKSVVHNKLGGLFYAYFPEFIANAPPTAALKKWDELLMAGKKVVAIGGSDAHALKVRLGPIHRVIFPYEYHFHAINTHLLVESPLSGDLIIDRRMIIEALRRGHVFIGYDLPASTRGFRFTAAGKDQTAISGDTIFLDTGITIQVRLPRTAECRLIKDGITLRTWNNRDICTEVINQPGIYRVECYITYLGKSRGWIYSNPIYVNKRPVRD
jgi:hypothetical protein